MAHTLRSTTHRARPSQTSLSGSTTKSGIGAGVGVRTSSAVGESTMIGTGVGVGNFRGGGCGCGCGPSVMFVGDGAERLGAWGAAGPSCCAMVCQTPGSEEIRECGLVWVIRDALIRCSCVCARRDRIRRDQGCHCRRIASVQVGIPLGGDYKRHCRRRQTRRCWQRLVDLGEDLGVEEEAFSRLFRLWGQR
jgi:hypothetical protein